jgi:hypothetical protein
MFSPLKFVMLFYDDHICGRIMFFMNLSLIVSSKLSIVLELDPTIVVSLISMKQCRRVVSQTRRFVLFLVCSKVSKTYA